MSIQAIFDEQAIDILGIDFRKWMNSQDEHHSNQIYCYAIRSLNDNSIPETCPANDIHVEELTRDIDDTYKHSDGYLSWSHWWYLECLEDDEDDTFNQNSAEHKDLGYSYTVSK